MVRSASILPALLALLSCSPSSDGARADGGAGAPLTTEDASVADTDGVDDASDEDRSKEDVDGFVAPVNVPSRQTVAFIARNASEEDRFLTVRGAMCNVLQIERREGDTWSVVSRGGFPQSPEWGCEDPYGMDWNGPGPAELYVLGSGQAKVLEWDARADVVHAETFDCPDLGIYGAPWRTTETVEPGVYRVTLGFFTEIPAWCAMQSNVPTKVNCDTGFASPSQNLSICETERTAVAEFVLPPDGDIEVDVAIP